MGVESHFFGNTEFYREEPVSEPKILPEVDFVVGKNGEARGDLVKLQNEFIEAVRLNKKEAIEAARLEYQDKFPGQIEGVEAMFQAVDFFNYEKRKFAVDREKKNLYQDI